MREQVRLIEKSVVTKEPRFMSRVIRGLVNTRRKMSPRLLRLLLNGYLTQSEAVHHRDELLEFLSEVCPITSSNCIHLLL